MNPKLAPADGPDLDGDSAAIKHAAADWKARADAGLSRREEADLRAWLEADPRHRAALARFDLVWDRFDRPFHAGATDQLLQELDVRAGRRRRRRAISAAAGLMVLLAVGSVWRFTGRPEAVAPAIVAVKPTLATNAVLLLPERRTLPDGSVAELKDGAQIAVDFSAGFRRVTLSRGEAHFQVTKDENRPFIVSAGGVEARAVGTAFSVQLRPTAVEVLVTEGRVSVVGPALSSRHSSAAADVAVPSSPSSGLPSGGSPTPDPSSVLRPPLSEFVLEVGKSIVIEIAAQQTTPPQVTAVDLDDRLSWRAPRVEFTRTSLAEAVAVLNGYAAGRRSGGQRSVQFIIDDASLNDVRVSGLFRVDKTDAFVGLLKNGFGIDAEPRGDSEIILRKAR